MSIPPRLRTGFKLVFIVIGVGLVATFAVVGIPQLIGAEHSFVVLSGSMEPEISPGDVVIVDEVQPESVAVGDTITYRTGPRSTTTHEVVTVIEDGEIIGYKTKGIANEDPDQGYVDTDQLVGKTILVVPYVGYVTLFANTDVGAALFLIVPGVLIILNELWELAKDWRHQGRAETEVGQDGD